MKDILDIWKKSLYIFLPQEIIRFLYINLRAIHRLYSFVFAYAWPIIAAWMVLWYTKNVPGPFSDWYLVGRDIILWILTGLIIFIIVVLARSSIDQKSVVYNMKKWRWALFLIPIFLLSLYFFLLPSLFLGLFFLDTHGSVEELFSSCLNMLRMIAYNIPVVLIIYAVYIGGYYLFNVNMLAKVIGMIIFPAFVVCVTSFYQKWLYNNFNAYLMR